MVMNSRPGELRLPTGHPWLTYPRWRMASHTLLGVLLAGMIGGLAAGLPELPDTARYVKSVLVGAVGFGAVLGAICAGIVAAFGPWLRRFHPFVQCLLMGAMAVAALLILLLGVASIDAAKHGFSQNGYLWSNPFVGVPLLAVYFGFPTFLAGSIGYAFAVWSPTRRGARVFWPVLGGALAVTVTLAVLLGIGLITSPQVVNDLNQNETRGPLLYGQQATDVRPGVCASIDGKGDYVEFDC